MTQKFDKNDKTLKNPPDANPDPITGEPGSHPVGVAGGGAAGAATGAAIGGVVGGPIGAAVGGVVGAVAGAAAGKSAAEAVNPTAEGQYWRDNYTMRPYYKKDKDFSHYEPAYRYGWETASKPEYQGRKFDALEKDLETNWPKYRGTNSTSEWRDLRDATRDSFDRIRTRTAATAKDAGQYTEKKGDSIWEQVKGNWKQFKGGIKEKWNDLTDDEIEQMEGRREKIVGKIQEKYGEFKWREADIEAELRTQSKRY